MPLEPKDIATISLSSGALTVSLGAFSLSLINFLRSRSDVKHQALRAFEQKRFEARTNVTQARAVFVQLLLLGTSLEKAANDKGHADGIQLGRQIQTDSKQMDVVLARLHEDIGTLSSSHSDGLDKQIIRMEQLLGSTKEHLAHSERMLENINQSLKHDCEGWFPKPRSA